MLKYDELLTIINDMFDGDLKRYAGFSTKEGFKASIFLALAAVCGYKAIVAYGKSKEAGGRVSSLTKMAEVQWEYWQPYD